MVTGLALLAQSLQAGGDSGQLGDGPLPTTAAVAAALNRPPVQAGVRGLLGRSDS